MALIDRTAFNALVDEPLGGDNTTGSRFNKAAIASVILDPTDAAIAAASAPTEQTTTATGTQNNFDLNARFTSLRCTGAAPLFTGFKVLGAAPIAGDRVIVQCLGTTARVADQDGGSTGAHQAKHPSTRGQIVGVNGTMHYVYDGTTARWRLVAVQPGAAIDVAFAAGNFTGIDAMTWTVESGDQQAYYFQQRGKFVSVTCIVFTTTVGGTPANALQIALPGGFAHAKDGGGQVIRIINNNTEEHGMLGSTAAGTVIRVYRPAVANWSAATNTTYVYLTGEFEVQ